MVTFYIDKKDQANKELFKSAMASCLEGQAYMGAFLVVATLFLFRDKPPTPPSAGSEVDSSEGFFTAICGVFKNRSMMILTLVLGQIVGVFNTMGTIIGEVSNAYGYSVADSAALGAMFICGGVLGCIPFGIWVGKY